MTQKAGKDQKLSFLHIAPSCFSGEVPFRNKNMPKTGGKRNKRKNNPIWMIGHGNDATYKNDFQIFKIARNGPRNGDHIHKKNYAIFKIWEKPGVICLHNRVEEKIMEPLFWTCKIKTSCWTCKNRLSPSRALMGRSSFSFSIVRISLSFFAWIRFSVLSSSARSFVSRQCKVWQSTGWESPSSTE